MVSIAFSKSREISSNTDVVYIIETSEWELVDCQIRHLYQQWGNFIAEGYNGKVIPEHSQAIYEAIRNRAEISFPTKIFFLKAWEEKTTYYYY
jgi:hypothetical protein